MNQKADLQTGELILDRKYRVEEFIGQGASAQVYWVCHFKLNVDRRVKVISRDILGVGGNVTTLYHCGFLQEAQLSSGLGRSCRLPLGRLRTMS